MNLTFRKTGKEIDSGGLTETGRERGVKSAVSLIFSELP